VSGFEFTPGGIVAMGAPKAAQAADGVAGATTQLALPAIAPPEPARRAHVEEKPARATLKPVDVIRLARARLREVEREIRRIRALERERDELRRLLDAADNKPRAVVRDLPVAKRA